MTRLDFYLILILVIVFNFIIPIGICASIGASIDKKLDGIVKIFEPEKTIKFHGIDDGIYQQVNV